MTAVLRWQDASPRVRLAAVSLPVVLVTTLLRELGLIDALAVAGYLAFTLYMIAEWPRLPPAGKGLLIAGAVSILALPMLAVDALPVVTRAFDRATYYATFVTALAFLREAASTSSLVRRCGYLIINQPPAKRYLTLSTGSLLFGVILNIGALNLLGVMTSRSNTLQAAGGNRDIQFARRRRMTLALLRGFSATPLASPFSITLVVILSSLPDLRWYDILPLGMGLAALMIGFGWWLDRRTAPRHLASLVPALDQRVSWTPLAQFAGLVLGIVAIAIGLELLLGISLVLAILLSAPPVALVWMAVQRGRHGPWRALRYAGARLSRRAVVLFPSLRAEVGILGNAGFVGVVFAAMLPPEVIREALGALHLAGPLIAVVLMATVLLASYLGLNPIVTVTLLASALADTQALGLSPALLGIAFMSAWFMAAGSSPVATSVLILSRLAGVTASTLGWRWNGRYTAGAFALMAMLLVALSYVL